MNRHTLRVTVTSESSCTWQHCASAAIVAGASAPAAASAPSPGPARDSRPLSLTPRLGGCLVIPVIDPTLATYRCRPGSEAIRGTQVRDLAPGCRAAAGAVAVWRWQLHDDSDRCQAVTVTVARATPRVATCQCVTVRPTQISDTA